MIIKQVSLWTVSRNDNFSLSLNININVSDQVDSVVGGGMKTTHRILRLVISVSKKSFLINREILQERWVIHPYVAKEMVLRTTQRGITITCPRPLLMKRM